MHLTRKIAGTGCEDKTCPAIWETDQPGTLAVQGARLMPAQRGALEGVPADEDLVLIPADILARLDVSGQL
jgi:hypothetical protein